MDAALVRHVWQRAAACCEYCGISQDCDDAPFEIDHIIAPKHGGLTSTSNLALCCFHDNSHKGSNIAGLDPTTRKLTPLFNPRRHVWHGIFAGRGPTSSAARL
jgi:5-methylcytosine-specific restriction endonuclease McrA